MTVTAYAGIKMTRWIIQVGFKVKTLSQPHVPCRSRIVGVVYSRDALLFGRRSAARRPRYGELGYQSSLSRILITARFISHVCHLCRLSYPDFVPACQACTLWLGWMALAVYLLRHPHCWRCFGNQQVRNCCQHYFQCGILTSFIGNK